MPSEDQHARHQQFPTHGQLPGCLRQGPPQCGRPLCPNWLSPGRDGGIPAVPARMQYRLRLQEKNLRGQSRSPLCVPLPEEAAGHPPDTQ